MLKMPNRRTYMKEILFNLALLATINYCKENKIDCSGSHLVQQQPRKFIYNLVRDRDGQTLVAVIFHKDRVPTYWRNKNI